MSKFINLANKVFGRLTVKGIVGRDKRNRHLWKTTCECGADKIVIGEYLRNGNTKSCGCIRKERAKTFNKGNTWSRKPPGYAGLTILFSRYRNHARDRGLVFELSREDVETISKLSCFYCGSPPSYVSVSVDKTMTVEGLKNSSYVYNGIDRVDNSCGYTRDNCVPCCGTCNQIKMDMKTEDLFAHIERMLTVYKANQKQS